MKLVNSSLLEDFIGGAGGGEGTTPSNLRSSSTASTLIGLSSSTTTRQQTDEEEEDVDTDHEDDDTDDGKGAMDSSAALLDDEDVEDVAAEEGDEELDDQDFLHHYGNDLPMAPYITKMMRLNSECSDPALLKNCLPGQKWKCINEEGRWRKHKCKFHVSEISINIEKWEILTFILCSFSWSNSWPPCPGNSSSGTAPASPRTAWCTPRSELPHPACIA